MKVDLLKYENPIKSLMRRRKVSVKLFDDILGILTEFLECTECKEILPKESFSHSKAFSNRGSKYIHCKDCCKELRKRKKGEGGTHHE